ncbi:MAG: hypothetical protein L6Q97_24190 [Thermoanaerobaculia bacterium]|nr:hypothetical protein [Thermoanaerobaculia bacterium]
MLSAARWFFVAFLAIFSGTACHKPGTDDPEIIVTFPPEFTVDLFEQRNDSTGAPVFGLWVESMAEFECGNYGIEYTVTVSGSAIAVQLPEVREPDTCLGPPGRARAFFPVGSLANGDYTLTFTLGSVIVNKGTLKVADGYYALSMPNAQGIDFQNRILQTIPDHYIWGFALAPAEPDLPVADQFIAGLKPLTAEPDLPPGYYGYFTVSGTGQYFFHKSIAPGIQYRPFLRRLNVAPDAVRGLLQSFRDDPGKPLSIRCFSTYGVL